jgi:hypothetical protein
VYGLDGSANQKLLAAQSQVGPKTQAALQAALAGKLLTAEQRSFLRGAIEKNTALSAAQKAAIASALQNDLDQKRLLQSGPGKLLVVVSGSGPAAPAIPSAAPAADGSTAATQSVRYLRVSNETGEALTVHVRLSPDDEPWSWSLEAGQTAYLAVDGQRLAVAQAYIWAESETRAWTTYKAEPMVAVSEPYASEEVGTHTHRFQP